MQKLGKTMKVDPKVELCAGRKKPVVEQKVCKVDRVARHLVDYLSLTHL